MAVHVVSRHGWQQVLLVLSLIAGVVAMHSAIACHTDNSSAPVAHVTAHSTSTAPHSSTVAAATSPYRSDGMSGSAEETSPPRMVAPGVADGTTSNPAAQPSWIGRGAVAVPLDFSATGPGVPAPEAAMPALAALSWWDGPLPDDSVPALHDLLHLCLAVLTALIALSAVVLLAVLAARSGASMVSSGAPRRASGPRAPPPTAVRLASLCVLRN
ncbi:hypothetical protein [Pseudonocardia sp. N23]|uniref:hypothetical protein n=1 Tax=Pseudonocardia sp. N23 TaxID=1987376 RepID=UPI000BFCA7B8|nr:hypothetical protein [Pseudonocardia sp. N23]